MPTPITPETLGTLAQPGVEHDLPFAQAGAMWLDYLRSYRSCSTLSVEGYRTDLRCFEQFLTQRFGRVHALSGITRQLVIQYAMSLPHLSPVTVRKKLACLSSLFGFLQDMGYVSANPARRLPLPKLEQRVPVTLSEEQVHQLLAAAEDPWHRCLVVLLLATGLRRSEVVQISLEEVDLHHRQLLVHGKGAKQRIVPLTTSAVEAVRHYLPHRSQTQSRRLFVDRRGEPLPGRVINETLDELLGKAGLAGQGITPHKLRHTFATQLIRRGVDIRTVQELLGHADLETTSRYLHSDVRTKLAAVGRLTGLLGGGEQTTGAEDGEAEEAEER